MAAPTVEPGVEARLAALEAHSAHIQSDVVEIKADLKQLARALERDFRLLFGALITAALGLAFVMAKGFHWF